MKQNITLTIFFSWLFISAAGQNFEQQFIQLYNQQDTLGEAKTLTQWKSTKPNDPELYVAYFNYYVQKSMQKAIEVEKEYLKKAYEYIDKGIAMFPNRLDMRFGKIYMLGQKENYSAFATEIIMTIDYSGINKNAWLWTDNKVLKEPKQFMLKSVQDYILQLYNTGDAKLLDDIKRISEAVLKYYPNNVESLLDLSIFYTMNKNYDKAIEQLLKAEKLAPTNYVVMNNIAEAYLKKGDKANAMNYYQKVMQYGDASVKADAQKKIDELKKK
jgi:tetratricopeptide (TPR) repeat protein